MSQAEVDAWIGRANGLGVKSIVCLLAGDQLPYYGELETDLISYYRAAGFICGACAGTRPPNAAAFTRSAHRNLGAFRVCPSQFLFIAVPAWIEPARQSSTFSDDYPKTSAHRAGSPCGPPSVRLCSVDA